MLHLHTNTQVQKRTTSATMCTWISAWKNISEFHTVHAVLKARILKRFAIPFSSGPRFDYAKAFDYLDHNKLWKILQEMGIPDNLTCFLRNLYASQEAPVRTRRGTTDWFQIRKGVYCLPAYLTYMQSTSCEMLDWMKHKLESRLLGEILITSDMKMTPHLWQKSKKN